MPGSAPRPVATPGLGQPVAPWSQPVRLGWLHGWARVATGLGRAQPGQPAVGLQTLGTDPLPEPAPTRTQRATVPGWHSGAYPRRGTFLERRLCAYALEPGSPGCGPQTPPLISLCLTPRSVKWAQLQNLPQRLFGREKVIMNAIKGPKQWLTCSKHFTNWKEGFITTIAISLLFLSWVLLLCTLKAMALGYGWL